MILNMRFKAEPLIGLDELMADTIFGASVLIFIQQNSIELLEQSNNQLAIKFSQFEQFLAWWAETLKTEWRKTDRAFTYKLPANFKPSADTRTTLKKALDSQKDRAECLLAIVKKSPAGLGFLQQIARASDNVNNPVQTLRALQVAADEFFIEQSGIE